MSGWGAVGKYLKGTGSKPKSGTRLGSVRARPARTTSRPARRAAVRQTQKVSRGRAVAKRRAQRAKARKVEARRKSKGLQQERQKAILDAMGSGFKRKGNALNKAHAVVDWGSSATHLAPHGRFEDFSAKRNTRSGFREGKRRKLSYFEQDLKRFGATDAEDLERKLAAIKRGRIKLR